MALAQEIVTLTMDGIRHEIDKRRVVLGRSKDCDIQLADPNVSRRHAELRQEGSAYWLVDLDSTNGIEVNGRRCGQLESGDTITVGSTDLVFGELPGAADDRLGRGRRRCSFPEDRLPAPALPLHLADRAEREPRDPGLQDSFVLAPHQAARP